MITSSVTAPYSSVSIPFRRDKLSLSRVHTLVLPLGGDVTTKGGWISPRMNLEEDKGLNRAEDATNLHPSERLCPPMSSRSGGCLGVIQKFNQIIR